MLNALSVDWENWSEAASVAGACGERLAHARCILASSTDMILDLFGEAKATFFVLACNARKYPHLVRRMFSAGHEIALHGLTHRSLNCYSEDQFERDIILAKKEVEDIIGAPVIGFRAPNWSLNGKTSWALKVLARNGFQYDASMTEGVFSGLSRSGNFPIREVPRSGVGAGAWQLPVAGGVFLRLYPYAWTRRLISSLHRSGRAAVVYLHPWEIDRTWGGESRLSWQARLVMGTGASSIELKLQRLLQEFEFGPVRACLGIGAGAPTREAVAQC